MCAGFHDTIANIICDVVATAGAVTMFLKPANRVLAFKSLWFQLVKENVLRTTISMIVNPLVMVANKNITDMDLMNLVYTLQNYTYIRLMNLELYFS
ncbi:hypothetical protein HDU98_006496 [Podochytrium sp. JEL0797]|nr:hypothetical protein HDU98_006496 [Podochytrium sp. JEL0797]